MRGVAGPLDLLGHEAPAGRPLERELGLAAGELSQPRTQLGARRRRDPAAPQLTRLLVERLVGDLVSMHIQRHYDPHRDLLELRRSTRHRVTTTLEPRGLTTCHLSMKKGRASSCRLSVSPGQGGCRGGGLRAVLISLSPPRWEDMADGSSLRWRSSLGTVRRPGGRWRLWERRVGRG